jgi:hypothetical protein
MVVKTHIETCNITAAFLCVCVRTIALFQKGDKYAKY